MCEDQTAFVAIGSGGRHAESQFMLAKYSGGVPNAEALLLAYSAKRNAEIAPGVGAETDIFVIGPGVGVSSELSSALKAKVEVEYKKILASDARSRTRGRAEVTRFLSELSKQVPQSQQPPRTAGTAIGAAATNTDASK